MASFNSNSSAIAFVPRGLTRSDEGNGIVPVNFLAGKTFEHRHTVRDDEIDGLGHVNNVAYVGWMQAAAVAHSAALGWPAKRYREAGCGWVVRSHQITYLEPALAGDEILVRTWVATMKKATSVRRYEICRAPDGARLATAETLWAFVDYSTGQPRRVLAEIAAAFPLVGDEEGA